MYSVVLDAQCLIFSGEQRHITCTHCLLVLIAPHSFVYRLAVLHAKQLPPFSVNALQL